jgi:hypothetical protein
MMNTPRRILPLPQSLQPQPSAQAIRREQGDLLPTTPAPKFTPFAVLATILCASLLLLLVNRSIATPVPQATQPTAAPAERIIERIIQATALPTPTPACTSAQGYLSIIAAQQAAGNYTAAATTAETTLRITGLCASDTHALTQVALQSGIAALYTAPFDPTDTAAEQHLVDRYESVRLRAQETGIPIDTDLQIARRSFASSHFLLSLAALTHAHADHQFNPAIDRDITHLLTSVYYNLGVYTLEGQPQGSERYGQGLAWLATSKAIADAYHTGQGEAAMKLKELLGPDQATWPAPAETPFLPAAQQKIGELP